MSTHSTRNHNEQQIHQQQVLHIMPQMVAAHRGRQALPHMHAEPQIKITQQQAQTGVCTLLKRHNQARAKYSRTAGHEDMDFEAKQDVMSILRDLGCVNIRHNMFLVIVDSEYQKWYVASHLTHTTVKKAYKVRRPDVICEYQDKQYIVEIDGGIHRIWDTDDDYDYLGIPYCKVDLDYLQAENISWRDWLKADMQKRGWLAIQTG